LRIFLAFSQTSGATIKLYHVNLAKSNVFPVKTTKKKANGQRCSQSLPVVPRKTKKQAHIPQVAAGYVLLLFSRYVAMLF